MSEIKFSQITNPECVTNGEYYLVFKEGDFKAAESLLTEYNNLKNIVKQVREFLDNDIANLECYGSQYTMDDDTWGEAMYLRDRIDEILNG